MKHRQNRVAGLRSQSALHTIAVAALAVLGSLPLDVAALGLGRLTVQSALGESLKAEIDVTALTPEEAASLKVRIAAPEVYRNAGVEFNPALSAASVSLQRRPDGRPYLRLSADRPVGDPFVDVILELNWASGRLMREFTLLLDPPTTARTPVPAAEPAPVAAAPKPAPSDAASAPAQAIPRAAVAPAERSAALPQPPAARPALPSALAGSGDQHLVQRGDTLSRIAGQTLRTQRSGVSLDQMLVALYRNNAEAFAGNNMNRLKAGAVLQLPSEEEAAAVSGAEAARLIQAQSADFDAYREKLAAGVGTVAAADSSRTASGRVQAEVQDRKTSAAATPDKLTLSKGAAASAKASAAEEALAKGREQKDSSTRVAELAKNVAELERLKGATGASGADSGAGAGVGAAPGPRVSVATPQAAAAASSAQAPTATVPAAAPAASVPSAQANAQANAQAAAQAAAVAASSAAAESGAAEAAASAAAATARAATDDAAQARAAAGASAAASTAPPASTEAQGPGFLDALLDNPLLMPGAVLLIALLAGFGIYRMRQGKRDSGETSFLESRLQPDSFFGASGGQRVDTRDATGVPSSMSYSLSQLDAIGDVDPVAEADVYLAYGRDLQAEEILKEAMRSNPDRMAIRLKLLEVYAKRRDTKGFEALAAQLHSLTGGEGEDWSRAQQLGMGIDPENPMYEPGGQPTRPSGDVGVIDGLGASTMPQSVLPSAAHFDSQLTREEAHAADVDLDLDISVPGSLDELPAHSMLRTQPMVPTGAAAQTAPPAFEFDLPSLDLDGPDDASAPATAHTPPRRADLDFRAAFDAQDGGDGGADEEGLSRKLELAEEFRQIGDVDGARDLLQEVIAQSGGALKSKAQTMLKGLG